MKHDLQPNLIYQACQNVHLATINMVNRHYPNWQEMSLGASVELIWRKCGQFLGEKGAHRVHIPVRVSVGDKPGFLGRVLSDQHRATCKAEKPDKMCLIGLQGGQRDIQDGHWPSVTISESNILMRVQIRTFTIGY